MGGIRHKADMCGRELQEQANPPSSISPCEAPVTSAPDLEITSTNVAAWIPIRRPVDHPDRMPTYEAARDQFKQ